MTIFIVIALVFAFYLSSGLFFKITDVRVEGMSVYTDGEIRSASGFETGENIFMINKNSAARAITNRFPYVERVRIRRELPGTVVIEITESAPVAMLEHKGEFWLINTRGVLLESIPVNMAPELAEILGVETIAPVVGQNVRFDDPDLSKIDPLLELLTVLSRKGLLDDVAWVDMTYLSNIIFAYTDRFTVEVGFPDHIESKIVWLMESLPKLDEKSPGSRGRFYLDTAHEDNSVRFIPE